MKSSSLMSLFDRLLEDDFRLAYRTGYAPFYPEGPIQVRGRRRWCHDDRYCLGPQWGSLRHCLSVSGAAGSPARRLLLLLLLLWLLLLLLLRHRRGRASRAERR